MESPGHTEDSTTLLFGIKKNGYLNKTDIHFVFAGEMILAGGLGRTNFHLVALELYIFH
jgi:glyoxylase-like metal-dependent hydrolase (beta-lactamase superfamily II)